MEQTPQLPPNMDYTAAHYGQYLTSGGVPAGAAKNATKLSAKTYAPKEDTSTNWTTNMTQKVIS